ncbi:MAG: hypothetical protein SFY80_07935 [Verrucomicrobiota bacterium]|nr:hypothetical protein [Verrucomicrobiota bacterium]
MRYRTLFLVLIAASLTAGSLHAQNLFRPPPRLTNDTVTIGWRAMFGVDVTFSKLGGVSLQDPNYTSSGSYPGLNFNDGYILRDNTFSADGSKSLDGKTVNFSYASASQVISDASGTSIDYHSYGSVTNATALETTDSGMANGWELQYIHYFGRKQRFGFLAGFSFNTFSTSQQNTLTNDLLERTYNHRTGSRIYNTGTTTSNDAGYTGPIYRPEAVGTQVTPATSINIPERSIDPSLLTTTPIPNGAEVDGDWEVNGSFYSFRIGPVYDLSLSKKFKMQVGAGLASVFFSSDFQAKEIVTAIGKPGKPTTFNKTQRDSEWLVGGYVDANANYQINERMNFFSGMQFQSTSDYTGYNDAREVKVNMANEVYMRAGVGFRF